MRYIPLLVLAVLSVGCVSPLDREADLQHLQLTEMLADGWFNQKPVPPENQRAAVATAIADIKRRLGVQ